MSQTIPETAPVTTPETEEVEEEVTPLMYVNHRMALARALVEQSRALIIQSSVENQKLKALVTAALEAITSPYPEQIPAPLVERARLVFSPLIRPLKQVLARCELVTCEEEEWSQLPGLTGLKVSEITDDLDSLSV